jgi:hypothetical protein
LEDNGQHEDSAAHGAWQPRKSLWDSGMTQPAGHPHLHETRIDGNAVFDRTL